MLGRLASWVALCALASIVSLGGHASAQPVERWLVLRSVAGEEPPGHAQAADQLEQAVRGDVTLLPREEASTLIEARHSAEPTALTQDEFDLLATETEAAMEHLAFGRRRRAREAVERILERAHGALDSLNRESRSARRVLNSCLYLVRALLDSGDRDAALSQAIDCARLVPDMTPSQSDHPGPVRELFAQAVDQMQHGTHGSLAVRSRPSGCSVYVNGRRLGTTPFERDELPTGEYRIQVECGEGRAGRVHRLVLNAERRELVIDERFDRVLRTSAGEVRLEYPDSEAESQHRLADALTVGELVGAQELLLMTAESPARLRVDMIHAPDRAVIASVRVAMTSGGLSRRDVAALTEALLAKRSIDLTAEPPAAIEPWSPPSSGAEREVVAAGVGAAVARPAPVAPTEADVALSAGTDGGAGPWGWIIGGTGLLALGAGWALEGMWLHAESRVEVAEPTDPDYGQRVETRDGLTAPAAVLGLAGGAVASAGVFLVLPRSGAEWWHYVVGAIGVAGAAVGAVLWAQEGSCIDASCSDRHRTVPLAPLLVGTSLPLIATPVAALIIGSDGGAERSSFAAVPFIAGKRGGGLWLRWHD